MRKGSWESVGAVAVALIFLGISAAFYLVCLAAVHISIGAIALLSGGSGSRHSDPTADRAVVTIIVTVVWAFAVAASVGLAFGTGTAWLVGLGIGLPVGAVAGWQVGKWQESVSWSRVHGALVLGAWRSDRFFVTRPFTITPGERLKHVICTGATGSGKSTLVRNLALQDIRAGAGACVIDPKDDLIDGILPHIPEARLDDIILFDATDREAPLGLNAVESVAPEQRSLATSELISVFRRQFSDSWGPRLEHLFRHLILALLEMPGATLLDVPRLLLDEEYLRRVAYEVSNPAVREFLLVEYERIFRRRADAVEPILNKLGAWLAYPELRAIIGQPESAFDFRRVMDTGKVLLVRIPQGVLGEDGSNLLGALVVARIQLAAQSRVDTPVEARRPFYCYVDEFQNFATSSFTKILTEARAFGLGLVCANQYFEQLPRELQQALIHNAATFVHAAYARGRYRLEVSSRANPGDDGSVFLVHPPAPLPPGDPTRGEEIRARCRARQVRPQAADGVTGRAYSGNGQRGAFVGTWGRDLDEE